jgi:hypothetical protein
VSRPSVVILAWAGLLAALALVLLAWTRSALENGLLFGAAAGVLLLAGLAIRAREPRRRVVPDLSLPTAVAAAGLGLAIAGSAFGTWLVLIGAGVLAVGLVGLVRERA